MTTEEVEEPKVRHPGGPNGVKDRQQYVALLEPDKRLIMKGRISHRNGEPSVIVEKIKELK